MSVSLREHLLIDENVGFAVCPEEKKLTKGGVKSGSEEASESKRSRAGTRAQHRQAKKQAMQLTPIFEFVRRSRAGGLHPLPPVHSRLPERPMIPLYVIRDS